MRTHLIRVGNSRGVRLPKPLIEEAGLTDAVEIRVRDGTIVIAGVARARSGWAEAAQRMRERGEDGLVDPSTPTRFDEGEWKW